MFTGMIETTGLWLARRAAPGGARLSIEPARPLEDLQIGESIAVNGVCLTVEAESTPRRLDFFLSEETLARSSLGGLGPGRRVNLERSLRLGDRLGGHLVMGHVDGLGRVRRWERRGEAWRLEVEYPPALGPLLATKGSVAIDGISLTVSEMGGDWFAVAVIPHTAAETNLAQTGAGVAVNLEADMLARYVARALEARQGADPQRPLTAEKLREAGFI